MRVRILGRVCAALGRPIRGFLEKSELCLLVFFEIIRVDRLRLDGGMDCGASGRDARVDRIAELACMIVAPRLQDRGVLGKRLAIAAMQSVPLLLECDAIVEVRLVGVRKFQPGFRHRPLLPKHQWR